MKHHINSQSRPHFAAIITLVTLSLAGCGIGTGSSGSLPTSIYLSSSELTAALGTSFTLRAVVGTTAQQLVTEDPNGTVTFFDGSTPLGTSGLTNATTATLAVSLSTSGTHILTASYTNGDSYYGPSTSNAVDVIAAAATPAPLASGGAGNIYVLQAPPSGSNYVLEFSTNSNGTAAPASTLTLPSGFTGTSIAIDSTGAIYVGGSPNNFTGYGEILVFAAGASGAATPLRTLTGTSSTFNTPEGLSLDSTNRLYVSSGNSSNHGTVSVFAANASGTPTPLQQIIGSGNYLITSAFSTAVDGSGNLYVAGPVNTGTGTPSEILVFPSGTTGAATPARVIAPAANTEFVSGLAVDASGDVYVPQASLLAGGSAAIVEFAPGANGTATPIRTIAGSATGLTYPSGLALDSAGNIFVQQSSPAVLAFGPTAVNEAVPAINLNSSTWTTDAVGAIAVH